MSTLNDDAPVGLTDTRAVNPRTLELAAGEARDALDGGWVQANEQKRARRYGYVLDDAPHQPTMKELLDMEDDERTGGLLAITPQPATGCCPTCGGSGRVRVEPQSVRPGAEIVEVWHGGIPNDAPPLRLCPLGRDCPTGLGLHSHTQRISDQPFSIPWQSYVEHHVGRTPTLVVHVIGGVA